MKNSEKNLAVIENFILHLTHCADSNDKGFKFVQEYTPEELYRVAYNYIEEDHVDGKGNPEDYKTEETLAREFLSSKGFFTDNLWSVADVQGKYECTDEKAQEILLGAFGNDATYQQIWESLDCEAESENLNKVDNTPKIEGVEFLSVVINFDTPIDRDLYDLGSVLLEREGRTFILDVCSSQLNDNEDSIKCFLEVDTEAFPLGVDTNYDLTALDIMKGVAGTLFIGGDYDEEPTDITLFVKIGETTKAIELTKD